MVRPAPPDVPYSRFSAWVCAAGDAFITVAASPNASDAPKPVIVWNVVPPLTVAVEAANAGTAGRRPPSFPP